MALQDKFVGISELAQVMGVSELTLKRTWLKRHNENGMPRKSPCGWLWPRRSIELWLAGAILPANDNDGLPEPAIVDTIESQNAALRIRYGGRA